MKFRAYDKQTNKMYYSPNSHIYLNIDGTCVNFQNGEVLEAMFCAPYKDKNKKNIYANDLVKMLCHPKLKMCQKNAEIKLIKGKWYFFPDGNNGETEGDLVELDRRCEVVGNTKQHKIEDFQ